MKINAVTAHVRIDARVFRRFAVYDTFIRRQKWKAPVLFCVILLVFSEIAFLSAKSQSSMIGTLLMLIGLGLPLAYLLSFLLQVHDQCKRLGLKTPRPAYTINLEQTQLRVINDMKAEEELRLAYDALLSVRRANGAYYIYAAQTRAFILPDGQYTLSPAQMWDFLSERLPQGKLMGKKP